jgi:hypothetical protein
MRRERLPHLSSATPRVTAVKLQHLAAEIGLGRSVDILGGRHSARSRRPLERPRRRRPPPRGRRGLLSSIGLKLNVHDLRHVPYRRPYFTEVVLVRGCGRLGRDMGVAPTVNPTAEQLGPLNSSAPSVPRVRWSICRGHCGWHAPCDKYCDMARLSLLLATAGLTVAILAFPTNADAFGPVDIEIGARAGVAAGPLGPLGFGIGGRGGVSILGLYAGIDVIDYLGATAVCGSCSSPPGQTVMQSRSALLYGFEAGYNLKVSRVTIRPQLGLGNLRLSSAYGDPTPGPGAISNHFYLEPGVVGLVSLGVLFVGADVGALLLFTGPGPALTVHGQIGVTF